MTKIAILLAIALMALSSQKVGSYVKDSFASNDIRIDRAWKTVMEEYYRLSSLKEEEVEIIPIAIYKQLVNGLNYKVFFGAVEKSSNKLKLFDYVVYTGPLTQSSDPFLFELTSNKELEDPKAIALRKDQYEQIKGMISLQLAYEGDSLINLSVLRAQINVLGAASIYFVQVQKQNLEAPEKYLIYQDEEGMISMVANWI